MHSQIRKSFTLIELLLVIGIIAVIAGIVILAINPSKQLSSAQTVKRSSEMNQLEKALNQFMIDKGKLPDDPTKYPTTKDDAVPICMLNPSNTDSCINVSDLVNTYIAAVPKDSLEPCNDVTGYAVYADKIGPHVVEKRDADMSSCPVGISWSGSNGTISNGQFTLSSDLDLQGKSLAINGNGSLNLNGHKVLNGTVTNNGTIVAQGNEQWSNVTMGGASAGAWAIVGKSDGSTIDPTILNGKSITDLTIAPTAAGTVVKPTSALSVSGKLTVASTAIFDTTGADSAFGGAVSNNGAIILGDNAVHFNGGYDSDNGQTVFTGLVLPSGLTYHDLTIASEAQLTGDITVNGTLTVNADKVLTIATGTTLTQNGNMNIQGKLAGRGTIDLSNGGQSVTVATTGGISGQDATNVLTLRALQAWFLKYAGTSLNLTNLNLTNAQNGSNGSISCSGCNNTGDNGTIHSCPSGQFWDGALEQCVTRSVCGNGIVESGEQCDMGQKNGPTAGCDATTCQIEPGFSCNNVAIDLSGNHIPSICQTFTVNGDNTVTNNVLGTSWIRCQLGMTWNGTACTGTPASKTLTNANHFCHLLGYRLPTLQELQAIVTSQAYAGTTNSFPGLMSSYVWTSSATQIPSHGYWAVRPTDGATSIGSVNFGPAAYMCVRCGSSPNYSSCQMLPILVL